MNIDNQIIISAFTQKGMNLALRLSKFLNAQVFVPQRLNCEEANVIDCSLSEWAGKYFHEVKAMIFVGACGIAVRAVAKYITSKIYDPAVIVIDEAGKFVIPVLSGHIGGANELSRKIAGFIGSQAVITTSTDINNLLAVDEWAVNHDCIIENPENIKHISSRIIENKTVGVAVTEQNIPAPFDITLWLRPKNLILGVGCNKGINVLEFEKNAIDFLSDSGVNVMSLKKIASIDIKSGEKAINLFAEKYNLDFVTFSADELKKINGKFTSSQVVEKYTGVDNVCERACILAAGNGGILMRSKTIYEGMTFALGRIKNDFRAKVD